MGYEQVFEGCMRSSVELRRIKNAKITAMRHRKWQEVRLQREAKEKKAAEEYLRRRRRERAQLAAYIYSSAQTMDKEGSTKFQSSQEHTSRNQTASLNEKDDFVGVKNHIIPNNKADEDTMHDVCRLPAISIKDESCYKTLLKQHAGNEQKETEATRDFLQEALQERLQNEAATSLLIAEITDMRSRLDDLLAKPLKGHNESREKAGLENKDVKVSHSLSEKNHKENISNAQSEGIADDSDNEDNRGINCCVNESLSINHRASQRISCWLQRDYVLGNLKADEVLPHPDQGSCTDPLACGQDTILTGKQLRCHPKGPSFQQKSDEEKIFLKTKVYSAKNSKLTMGSVKDDGFNQLGLCCQDVRCILQRMSQESHEQESQRDTFSTKEDASSETIVHTGMLAGCQPIKEHTAKVVSKSTCLRAASDLLRTHKAAPVEQQCVSRKCEDVVSFCLKSKRDSTKLLDAEKSLLASLERLDVKLAMASANIHNSSRASLVSAGDQSTKSAPCAIRQKPGSDAYSVNSTMFVSRPTTSHLGGTSLFSKRRQNIGATNVSKDRGNHLQTCNFQHISCGSRKEDRKPPAGTIILHQNAEFLFN